MIYKRRLKNFPEVITICGSTRFKEQFIEVNKKLTLEGKIVISVGSFGHTDNVFGKSISKETKEKLDWLHRRKIDLTDSIVVIDVNGYIGDSTKGEIEYATQKGKKIIYYSKDFNEIK